MRPLRVVLDTCVLISGLTGYGASNRVLEAILAGSAVPVLSREVFREYVVAVLHPALEPALLDALAVLDKLWRSAVKVEPIVAFKLCRDPRDDRFLEAAYAGGADHVVTFDRELLSLRGPGRALRLYDRVVGLLTPTEFLRELRASGEPTS